MIFIPFISISNLYQHILLFFGKKAKINRNGRIFWYENGCLHRLDGPAAESYGGAKGGAKEWYKNGKLHREDGPAVEFHDGDEFWLMNGEFHRINGPAIERASGEKSWCQNGKLHRLDGPAMEYSDGYVRWYINGIRYPSKEEYFNNLDDESKSKILFNEDFFRKY